MMKEEQKNAGGQVKPVTLETHPDAAQPRGGVDYFLKEVRFLKEYVFTPQNLRRAGDLGVELGSILADVVLFVNEMNRSGRRSIAVEQKLHAAGYDEVIRQLRASE